MGTPARDAGAYGHQRGAETLKSVTRHAHGRGIRWLTAFAFSFENWSRPKPEVDGLMGLLRGFLENDVGVLNEENVKLRVIGNRSRFTPRLGRLIEWAEHETAANTGINLTLALDYGGRQELPRRPVNWRTRWRTACLIRAISTKTC